MYLFGQKPANYSIRIHVRTDKFPNCTKPTNYTILCHIQTSIHLLNEGEVQIVECQHRITRTVSLTTRRHSYERLHCLCHSQGHCWTGHNVIVRKEITFSWVATRKWREIAPWHSKYILSPPNLLFIRRFLVKWNEIILYYGNDGDEDRVDDANGSIGMLSWRLISTS